MVITSNKIRLAATSKVMFKAGRVTKVEKDAAYENLTRIISATRDNKTLIEIEMIKTNVFIGKVYSDKYLTERINHLEVKRHHE